MIVGTAIATEAHAEPAPEPDPVPPTPGPVIGAFVPPTPQKNQEQKPEKEQKHEQDPEKPEPEKPDIPVTPGPDEIEVLAYERVTNDDGSQMDIAVVNNNGEEMAYVDVNLDGIADVKIYDVNGDGMIQDTETEIINDQNISMLTMQDAVGFNPLYAQNDMPDYVNDADPDVYMA